MPLEHFNNFNETDYLDNNLDVKEAVVSGKINSGISHFIERGHREGRFPAHLDRQEQMRFEVERFEISSDGYCFIVGWAGDFGSPIDFINVKAGALTIEIPAVEIYRWRRPDVEVALMSSINAHEYNFGFFIVFETNFFDLLNRPLTIEMLCNLSVSSRIFLPAVVTSRNMCLDILSFVGSVEVWGSHIYAVHNYCENGLWASLNSVYVKQLEICKKYTVRRFNSKKIEHSFITVLFGDVSPVRMIGATAFEKIDKAEWIFVNNSPELAQTIDEHCRIVSSLYDVPVTLIQMAGNVGFGYANNVAASEAYGSQICVYNPDVLPRGSKSFQNIFKQPSDLLRGAVLYYADGSIMHNGMVFENDIIYPNRSIGNSIGPAFYNAVRVEHLDKGTPSTVLLRDRNQEVRAVTGAIMIMNKSNFISIGGFSESYMFGHYEDANLCVRWTNKFGPGSVSVDNTVRLIHLESQGSDAGKEPYRGAAKINRWSFTKFLEENEV